MLVQLVQQKANAPLRLSQRDLLGVHIIERRLQLLEQGGAIQPHTLWHDLPQIDQRARLLSFEQLHQNADELDALVDEVLNAAQLVVEFGDPHGNR